MPPGSAARHSHRMAGCPDGRRVLSRRQRAAAKRRRRSQPPSGARDASAAQTEFARQLFPDGVSEWGLGLALDEETPLAVTIESLADRGLAVAQEGGGWLCGHPGARTLRAAKDRLGEVVAELVRQVAAPMKPSRYQSLFGYRDLEGGRLFRTADEDESAPIWRVRCAAPTHDGDSRWLGMPDTPLKLLDNAGLYWQGVPCPVSFPWEHETLLPPPVEVLDAVG